MRDSCVVALLPWNFPMAMLAWKIGPALATGNSAVIKPPEPATLTTLRLAELASQAGIRMGSSMSSPASVTSPAMPSAFTPTST